MFCPGPVLSATIPVFAGAGATLRITTGTDGLATFYYRQVNPAAAAIITFQIGADMGEVYIFPTSPVGRPEADVGADGLPDVWEIHRFGSLRAQCGGANPDGDALSNYMEMLLKKAPLSGSEGVVLASVGVNTPCLID